VLTRRLEGAAEILLAWLGHRPKGKRPIWLSDRNFKSFKTNFTFILGNGRCTVKRNP
jgi:hypothetical protein